MTGMRSEAAIDEFRLAYDRTGSGPVVLLLHGWPGDRTDYRAVVPLVARSADVIVPDLRGFGESDKHPAEPARQYNAAAQARSIAGLIGELGLGQVVLAGYDIGSRIAQAVARDRPDLVRALVIAPPLPGIGDRILAPQAQREFWYQAFHNLGLSAELIDGRPERRPRVPEALLVTLVRPGLRAGRRAPRSPGVGLRAAGRVHRLDRVVPGGRRVGRGLTGRKGPRSREPGHGAYHRAVAGIRPAVPPRMVRPDRRFLCRCSSDLADNAGHFSPLEAPGEFAAAVVAAAGA